MNESLQLKLKGSLNPFIESDLKISQYDQEKHHNIIPELYALGFNDTPWEKDWDKVEFFDPEGVFLAELNGKLIGFIICFSKKDDGYISVLTIIPEYRGKGFSKKLIKKAVDYLQDNGHDLIKLKVEKNNSRAIQLYKELGFSEA
ncbi:MAG: GNAT family N-acetyltransferase [Spirochaetes bacterium]|nr:GNAT family N-acetyltransferase [Spirochaetota bacterium]